MEWIGGERAKVVCVCVCVRACACVRTCVRMCMCRARAHTCARVLLCVCACVAYACVCVCAFLSCVTSGILYNVIPVDGNMMTIFLQRTREGHRQSDEYWNYLKDNGGKISERWDGANVGFPEHIDTVLN